MASKSKLPRKDLQKVRLRTQLSLVRNVPGIPFPLKMPEKLLRDWGERLTARLIECIPGAEDITDDVELALTGEVLYGILPANERSAGYHLLRLPSTDPEIDCWCEVMCTNHLTFSATGRFIDSQEPLAMLEFMVRNLERKMPFVYDEKLGYLSAQLTLVGTGLRIRSWLHLAGLTHFNYLHELANAAEAAGLLVEMDEHGTPPPGCLFILFNRHTLGHTAEDIVHRFDHFLTQVVKQECIARKRLAFDEPYLLLDRLIRAQALFANALMMGEDETQDLLSDLRLGADVGAITKCKTQPLACDWFEMMCDSVFCHRFLDLLEGRIQVPPAIVRTPQWRLEAYRAEALRLFSKFDISETFLRKALPL